MKTLINLLFVSLLTLHGKAAAANAPVVYSPDKQLKFTLSVQHQQLVYRLSYKGHSLIDASPLQLSFQEGNMIPGNVRLGTATQKRLTETYRLITGKASTVLSDCNSMAIPVINQAKSGYRVSLEVRVFNDGAAFRYVLTGSNKEVRVTDEINTFKLTGNPTVRALLLPNYTTSHEGLYTTTPLKSLKADTLMDMPALFEYSNGSYLAITEAALRDYAGMYLIKHNGVLQSRLSPLPNHPGIKVIAGLPHHSPWRVMMVGDRVGTLIESNILTNLNEPNRIKDTSWIKPGTCTFPWWNGTVVPDTSFTPGNNFNTNMYYVNFCAKNHITYHTVVEYGGHEWYVNDGYGYQPGKYVDPAKGVDDLNMQQLCDSAQAKGVGIRVWVHWAALYPKLDSTFTQYEKWGIKGMMVDFMDRDDQQMVNIQEEILQKAAQHHLHIQFHGAYKPTGLNRTYPNEFTREGSYNYENDKWNDRLTPDHDANIAFTRLLAGATDYHLGGFNAVPSAKFRVHYIRPMVQGTRCHMLGMYVVLESYLGMICDYPDAYTGQPGFEFLQQVPTTWDATKVTNAKAGEYAVIARAKGRDWYIGGITNHSRRQLAVPLNFLPPGQYEAELFTDAPDAESNGNHLTKTKIQVNRNSSVQVNMAAGGGMAMHIYPATKK